jgi:hypothetical protein
MPLRQACTLSRDIYRGDHAYPVCQGIESLTIHAEKGHYDRGDTR